MRWRSFFWILVSVACFVGAVYFWRLGDQKAARQNAKVISSATAQKVRTPSGVSRVQPASTSPMALIALSKSNTATTNAPLTVAQLRQKYRLRNTNKTVGELSRSPHAILLANALIDSTQPVNLDIPDSLKAHGDPGTYLVQSRGLLDDVFRQQLKDAGAIIVSYFPNNAYQVRADAGAAQKLAALPGTQAVLPYEPYYKIPDVKLLAMAVQQEPLPPDSALALAVFPDALTATLQALNQAGVEIVGQDRSPFGPVLQVKPEANNWTMLAGLQGVQTVELMTKRTPSNDLSRPRVGVAADSQTLANYLGLDGTGVNVLVSDTGVDAGHPDLTGRVSGLSLTDANGHGTHVAGIIAGSGAESLTVTNAYGSIMPPTNGQFRGMAPGAGIFSEDFNQSDFRLQELAGSNAPISNNSWNYAGSDYDIAAASYDAAVRDSLPGATGSQPVVYVFSAGDAGNGNDDGTGVSGDSIQSPATAKNVITVGAIEQLRNITNEVQQVDPISGTTNVTTPWEKITDSDSQVASFSGRGNVGVNVEGDFGRYKPDLVAPGTFVVSTRSEQWDQNAYYNPVYDHYNTFDDSVDPGTVTPYPIYLPYNAIDFQITATAINPVVGLPIYISQTGFPTPSDTPVGTNFVNVPNPSPLDTYWFYGVGDPTNVTVNYQLTSLYQTTNDLGNYFEVLSNMNNQLGPFYRYESGTSMSAGDVSGLLALMEQYFAQQHITPSPALLKAMLINGARTVDAGLYDLEVQKNLNDQGWGLPNLPNSLPEAFSPTALNGRMVIFDQDPTNALATGESRTYTVTVSPDANPLPLRVTLVWTDPPGNPAAGVKLVNDLDLVVTNLDNPTNPAVYFGNDIPAGSSFTFPWDTNSTPNRDVVNNVENVFIEPPVGTNFTITVMGRAVNVNAVTAQTNNIVQDYALVISSGDEGEVTNAITVSESSIVGTNAINLTVITNDFAASSTVSGQVLSGQHVGANSPLLGTNTVSLGANTAWGSDGTNGVITLGETNQWHFYAVTNTTTFTNAVFATFLPVDLSATRMGVTNYQDPTQIDRPEADLDLFVSRGDPSMLDLNPAAVATADKSVGRGGTEMIVYSNVAPNEVFYVGVQSQDQRAAEYTFAALFSEFPFGDNNNDWSFFPVPSAIPDGNPQHPGGVTLFCPVIAQYSTRRIVLTNWISHENMGDLFGSLSHAGVGTVLNNHSCPQVDLSSSSQCVTNWTFVYEDNGELLTGPFGANQSPGFPAPGSVMHTDGPGSLKDYIGQPSSGIWLLTEVDNAAGSTGAVQNVKMHIDPEPPLGAEQEITIQPNSFGYTSVDVPPEATNMTIAVKCDENLPLELFVKLGVLPTPANYDYFLGITTPDTAYAPYNILTVNQSSYPPLGAGRYYVGIYNPNSVEVHVYVTINLQLGARGVPTINFTSEGPTPILDDAVSYSYIFVTNKQTIVRADVAVSIQHPRVSDLALTLVSPIGKRILLFENRGGPNTANLGSYNITTNFFGTQTAGGFLADTNVIGPVPTAGTLLIDYDFYPIPDTMDVYYDGVDIFPNRSASGPGEFTIPYGPGTDTTITIVMNQGNNTNTTTQWIYTPSVISTNLSYFTFSENTNLTQLPVKFFESAPTGGVVTLSDFEAPVLPGDYLAQTNVAGWLVDTNLTGNSTNQFGIAITNQVSVVNDATTAQAPGSQFLALGSGIISTNLTVVPGSRYVLSYDYRGPGIAAWWRGEFNTNNVAIDYVGGNNGILENGMGFSLVGEVGGSLFFNGVNNFLDAIPASPGGLDVGQAGGFTIEGWINPTNTASSMLIMEYERILASPSAADVGIQFTINAVPFVGVVPGALSANIKDTAGADHVIGTVSNLLTGGVWQHVALTYNQASGLAAIFVNGSPVTQSNLGSFIPQTSFTNLLIGARTYFNSVANPASVFSGKMDEVSLYSRALSPTEIRAIWNLGSAGKFDQSTSVLPPNNLAKAQVLVSGFQTNLFYGNNSNWLNQTVSFLPNLNTLVVQVAGLEPGMLMDNFKLTEFPSDVYVFPEQTLQDLVGDSSYGDWKLEVWDNRAGPFLTSQPEVASWQLRFILQTNYPVVIQLTNGVPFTNTIAPCHIDQFYVDVPPWAGFAVNRLLFATPPGVNVWFNQDSPATGTNAGDILLITPAPSTGGSFFMTTNTTPPLVPGARYFLTVENPCSNTTNETYAIEVDFGGQIITLTNMVPYTGTNQAGTNAMDYYVYNVSSNAARAQFEILYPSGNMTLTAHQGLPPPSLSPFTFDYISDNPGFNDELIVVLTNSTPVALTNGPWYLTASDISGAPATYWIMASEWPVTGRPFGITNVMTTNSELCLTWDTLFDAHYYIQGALHLSDTNWYAATYTLTAVTNLTTYCLSLPMPFQFYRVAEGLSLVDVPQPRPDLNAITTTNGVDLTWINSVTARYMMQWTPSLSLTNWNTFTNVITSTNGYFMFLDDGTQTGGFDGTRFYRASQIIVP